MPEILQLGPLVMATDRLLAAALVMAFLIGSDRIALRYGRGGPWQSGLALLAGILAARLAYVAAHFDAFSRDWPSALAICQGGFTAWAGIAAAALVVAWRIRPRPAMIRVELLLAVLALAWFGASELLRPPPRPMPAMPQLAALQGNAPAPEQLEAGPYVVNLWATWCPPCRRELPMLAEMAQDAELPILLVNQGEDAATVQAYLAANGVDGSAVLLDTGSMLTRTTQSSALPTTLFVDGDGMIVRTHMGEISRAALSDGIAQIAE